jgi:hypothetical protein
MNDSDFYDLNDAIEYLEACFRKKRGNPTMIDREALIQRRGFQDYVTYLYKENARKARHETRPRS